MRQLDRYKTCPSCGEENLPNAADCVRCGADILMERVERRMASDPIPSNVATLEIQSEANEATEAEAPATPHLILESLVEPSRTFIICEGQTVGRADLSDVVIEGIPDVDSVSRRMARFDRRGAGWFVQHIASTNYIVVDGEEYESDDEVTIRDGTILGLALCQFFVRIPEVSR